MYRNAGRKGSELEEETDTQKEDKAAFVPRHGLLIIIVSFLQNFKLSWYCELRRINCSRSAYSEVISCDSGGCRKGDVDLIKRVKPAGHNGGDLALHVCLLLSRNGTPPGYRKGDLTALHDTAVLILSSCFAYPYYSYIRQT